MSRRLNSNEDFFNSLNEIIAANFDKEDFGVTELAHALGMSRSNLHRKIKAITKTSANQYLRIYRLKKAREMLEKSADTVSQIAYKTGFGSPSYFIKCFHDYYGYSPGEVGIKEHIPEEEATIQKSAKNRKKIGILTISIFLVVFVITFLLTNGKIIPEKNKYQKTIAVLPFIDDSPESGNEYIINGLMDEILDKLERIQDFSVKSRTDSEKFRDSNLSIRDIARELKVNYILEGSGQKIENKIKLRIQLIEARSGDHIWSKTYTEDSEDIFELQENVALSVASKLNTKLTPDEKSQIRELPTKNMVAYNLYLKGNENYRIANVLGNISDGEQSEIYQEKGKAYFLQAIQLDSCFASAYLQLATFFMNYIYHDGNNEHKQMCLDSAYYYAKKSLEYYPDNDWAKGKLAEYYDKKGMREEADKIRENYSDWGKLEYKKYQGLVSNYGKRNDFYNTIQSYFRYMELKPANEFPPKYTLDKIIYAFQNAGFYEAADMLIQEKLSFYSDTLAYYREMAELERHFGNFQKSLELALKAYEKNSENAGLVMKIKSFQQDYTGAYTYCLEDEKKQYKSELCWQPGIYYGYVHLKNGNQQKATINLLENVESLQEEIEFNMLGAQKYESHFFLFLDFLALGEKEKAFSYLSAMKKMEFVPSWIIADLNYWPGLDEVRNHPVFIDVKETLTSKYQDEHTRIEKLLKERGETELQYNVSI